MIEDQQNNFDNTINKINKVNYRNTEIPKQE